jgi:hypothetical protein
MAIESLDPQGKSNFCKSFQWNPTAVSLKLGKIEWLDLTGLMDLPNKNVAKIELAQLSVDGDSRLGFEVTIFNPNKGKVDSKLFEFVDYLDPEKRKDERPDYKGPFKVIAHCGWEWYIAVPASTREFCAAIESYIHYFSR